MKATELFDVDETPPKQFEWSDNNETEILGTLTNQTKQCFENMTTNKKQIYLRTICTINDIEPFDKYAAIFFNCVGVIGNLLCLIIVFTNDNNTACRKTIGALALTDFLFCILNFKTFQLLAPFLIFC